jgi:hypothetical protein
MTPGFSCTDSNGFTHGGPMYAYASSGYRVDLLELERELSSKDHAMAALTVGAAPLLGLPHTTLLSAGGPSGYREPDVGLPAHPR